jgi:hypothetical protein
MEIIRSPGRISPHSHALDPGMTRLASGPDDVVAKQTPILLKCPPPEDFMLSSGWLCGERGTGLSDRCLSVCDFELPQLCEGTQRSACCPMLDRNLSHLNILPRAEGCTGKCAFHAV